MSCTAGVNLHSVDYETLFNDDNTKVWLVNKVYLKNAVISPSKNSDKNLMIFYKGGDCDFIPMKDITRKSPQRAKYYLNSRKKKISIEFDDYTMDYTLPYLTEDSILMKPTVESDYEYGIQLIPFQRL